MYPHALLSNFLGNFILLLIIIIPFLLVCKRTINLPVSIFLFPFSTKAKHVIKVLDQGLAPALPPASLRVQTEAVVVKQGRSLVVSMTATGSRQVS